MALTKNQVLPFFDNNQAKLGRELGLTKQGVKHWPDDGPMPEVHELKLRYVILPKIKEDIEKLKQDIDELLNAA